MLSESIPSLLPLLLDLESMSILEGRGTTKLSPLRDVAEDGKLDADGADDPRRTEPVVGLSWRISEDLVSDAMILEMETDVVAGVKAGRRILECRRSTVFSSSVGLPLGEECEDCDVSPLRQSVDAVEVLRRAQLSLIEELGREDDIPMELELLEAVFEPGVTVPCLPLPECGTFMGFVTDLETPPFIAARLPLRDAALEGDLRLPVGDVFGNFKGKSKALRMFSTPGGIGVP